MEIQFIDCIVSSNEQGSHEWHMDRLGAISASQVSQILTPTGKVSSSIEKLVFKLSAEKAIGIRAETFTSKAMLVGTNTEPEARDRFEVETGETVVETGFIFNTKTSLGCSPDGIIIRGGVPASGLEIKCPMPKTHMEYLSKGMPAIYMPQVQACMAVTGMQEWVFMSYCIGLKPLVFTCSRDDDWIDKLLNECTDITIMINEAADSFSDRPC
ncbi:lambda exonuclease family protein [Solemya elarraichensis gill symbiont]|uniref:YqaJ viral recombinase domain-containing protein n=1 Tax=Solemya elarraichensis gill symbiont TaxID=1918949 RepID=A0A1T2L059_9GAMM|nr:lambda exonuclease family protein [Solemya elarraichensis gill symbiont]OOZ38444.1 hypothetical protein BOW52_08545 [Solemya elarraichensis gill symbiont]